MAVQQRGVCCRRSVAMPAGRAYASGRVVYSCYATNQAQNTVKAEEPCEPQQTTELYGVGIVGVRGGAWWHVGPGGASGGGVGNGVGGEA